VVRSLDADGMVVIPAGHFTMGSTPAETSRENLKDEWARWEHPQHEVQLRSFALAKYDVTRGDYAQFVQATGHSGAGCFVFNGQGFAKSDTADWRSPGFDQTDRDPVVCVDHDDAEAYVRWYSSKMGHEYRLPTEAEWEYAARAGTTTARYWGDDAGNQCSYANGADQAAGRQFPKWTVASCSDGYVFTSPVGTFQPNAWGLYDMLGNVWQWTQDCWNESYTGAPTDGSAWTTGNCGRRVVRGGSWYDNPADLRSANRGRNVTGGRSSPLGFRLARTLP
jgi:formylglycine-generating enzyme required for sulfatase activity